MTYRLVISPQAASQLTEGARWYREKSGEPEVADQWVSGFLALLRTLDDNPDRYPLAQEAEGLEIEIREVHYGSGKRTTHRALFRIRGKIVDVLAIRHHAQRDVTRSELGLE